MNSFARCTPQAATSVIRHPGSIMPRPFSVFSWPCVDSVDCWSSDMLLYCRGCCSILKVRVHLDSSAAKPCPKQDLYLNLMARNAITPTLGAVNYIQPVLKHNPKSRNSHSSRSTLNIPVICQSMRTMQTERTEGTGWTGLLLGSLVP